MPANERVVAEKLLAALFISLSNPCTARTFSSSATQGIDRVLAVGKLKKRVAHLCSDKPTLEIPGNLQGLLDKPP